MQPQNKLMGSLLWKAELSVYQMDKIISEPTRTLEAVRQGYVIRVRTGRVL